MFACLSDMKCALRVCRAGSEREHRVYCPRTMARRIVGFYGICAFSLGIPGFTLFGLAFVSQTKIGVFGAVHAYTHTHTVTPFSVYLYCGPNFSRCHSTVC